MTSSFQPAHIARFDGFTDVYDAWRPAPPQALAQALAQFTRLERLALVVDLGSGSGLSTRYWAALADQVTGVEPGDEMRRQAEQQTTAANVHYQAGFSHQTGLPAACTALVTCSQALHWMEPQPTFIEMRRILQPGGVFAAYDYDWPPTTPHWEADAAFQECMRQVRQLERQLPQPVRPYAKEEHL